jgi:D-alanyl-D-alanine carboxypeptidase
MDSLGSRAARALHLAAGACVAAAVLAASATPAHARGEWRHYHRVAHGYVAHHRGWAVARRPVFAEADPAFSAIVVDANTGREIYGVNENGLRHPASITKVMTLYLLFEQLDKGAMTLQSRIPISEHAAAQEPSKLGISAGDSLSVDEAIKAIVTRSANDVAVAIAEAVGGDESTFAQMMTRKAHALGMSRTIYRNASGLPNDEQITTAHDLTVLARATEERFPRYFHYFSTHEFDYAGEIIGNHNHLLGRVDGVDGIKTGYTRASGFNLLTSVHRDGRSLVAVVMGGRTAGARDRMMEQLIADHIAEASAGGHTATMIADNEPPTPNAAPFVAPLAVQSGRATSVVAFNSPASRTRPAAEERGEGDNSSDDDEDAAPRAPVLPKPVVRPTATPVVASEPKRIDRVPVEPARIERTAAIEPAHAAVAEPAHAGAEPARIERAAVAEPARIERASLADPRALGWVKGPDAVIGTAKPTPIVQEQPASKRLPAGAPVSAWRRRQEARTEASRNEQTQVARAEDAHVDGKTGWIVQIGATDAAGKANDLLIRARAQNRSTLAAATAVTEKVKRGGGFLYRARFAGLDAASAEQACRSLKRSGFTCFATHD